MSKYVVFKGSRDGLQLVLDETAEFSSIVEQLKLKLESAMHFFGKGTTVNIDAGKVTKEQETKLSELFDEYGLTLKMVEPAAPAPPLPAEERAERQTMVLNRTVRGGEEISCRGSVIVCGNVNPGAKIIAGGNIEVKGTCRGVVHAGAFGDVAAVVIADRMMAMQIRIADVIARAPDEAQESQVDSGTEYACIRNGNIVIEPVNKQEVC